MRVSADVVARRIDDTIVLVHLGTDQIYSLNVTGSRLWELLADEVDTENIVSLLVAEFDTDDAVVRDEVERLTDDLLRNGLLIEHSDG